MQTKRAMGDAAVSPVIGTILMVAITVMLAAGVYTWTSMFASDQETPEQVAVRTVAIDVDDDGRTEWIRAVLVTAKDAPFHLDTIEYQLMDPEGDVQTDKDNLCASADAFPSGRCKEALGDEWDVGQSIYLSCRDEGTHLFTLKIRSTTVVDDKVRCDTEA